MRLSFLAIARAGLLRSRVVVQRCFASKLTDGQGGTILYWFSFPNSGLVWHSSYSTADMIHCKSPLGGDQNCTLHTVYNLAKTWNPIRAKTHCWELRMSKSLGNIWGISLNIGLSSDCGDFQQNFELKSGKINVLLCPLSIPDNCQSRQSRRECKN